MTDINIFKSIFLKHRAGKKKAVIFVDYEHWYISLAKMYGCKPDIRSWVDDLHKKVNVQEIVFFGDFSREDMKEEIQNIRVYTSKIVETKNAGSHYKKDFTDFIMLDYIYQKAIQANKFDTAIIFTGDGHFTSVVSFLKNYCKKEIGIYAVKDALSNQLKTAADWFIEIPTEDDMLRPYYDMILTSLKNLEDSRGGKPVRPIFLKTVEIVSRQNNVPVQEVQDALQRLIDDGYIERIDVHIQPSFRKIKILSPRWDLLTADGLWPPQSQQADYLRAKPADARPAKVYSRSDRAK